MVSWLFSVRIYAFTIWYKKPSGDKLLINLICFLLNLKDIKVFAKKGMFKKYMLQEIAIANEHKFRFKEAYANKRNIRIWVVSGFVEEIHADPNRSYAMRILRKGCDGSKEDFLGDNRELCPGGRGAKQRVVARPFFIFSYCVRRLAARPGPLHARSLTNCAFFA